MPALPVTPPAPTAAHDGREDPRAAVRLQVEQALAPVLQSMRDMHRRLDDLERRPAPMVVGAAAPAIASALPEPPRQAAAPQAGPPSAIPVTVASLSPRAPIFDVKAIERDVTVVVDGALDGSKRRLRLGLTFAFILLAVFGGLFFALAQSYRP
jgi:hypothetical protein